MRAFSPALDVILENEFPILDKGFVRVIDYMGNDSSITQAARVSYGAGTKTVSDDAGLINRLMRDKHSSPFEMNEIKLHIKMPLFVARQWIRHRTASLNEYSARYSIVKDEFYIPSMDRIQKQSKTNKQGSEENSELSMAQKIDIITSMEDVADWSMQYYKRDTEDYDVARELARINMPLSNYTEMYWKIDLHNLLHFLRLRIDSHAQYEIRVYADKIADIVKLWCPIVWAAFEEYQLYSTTFSRKEMELMVTELKSSERPDNFTSGEYAQFLTKIGK